jgi:iron complex outermembrane recepter protein
LVLKAPENLGVACVQICSAAFFLFAPSAFADEVDPFALAPEQLFDATIVSVSRSPESLWDAPAAVYAIGSQDIERAGATSVAEALRLAPGVEVAQIGAGNWAVSVRGFNSTLANKLLVLVDGREVYDPLFSGVYWDSLTTPLADIDRIEVVRGPGATMWGANAVNGIVNIITKNARDTQGWLASAAIDDRGGDDYSMRLGGNSRRINWRVYARWLDRPSSPASAGGDANDAWETWRTGVRIDAQLGPHSDLMVQGETYASDTGDLRAAPDFSPPFSSVAQEELGARGGHVLARWRRSGEGDSELSIQAYADFNRRERLALNDERTTIDLDTQYEFQTLGAHKVSAGFGYRNTRDAPENTALIRADRATIREERLSAFLQDRITLEPGQWVLTLGSKFEDHAYSGFDVQPSMRMQWFGGETQTAWASVSRALRSPSEIEREYNIVLGVGQPVGFPFPISLDLVPNPEFDNEEVIAYEAGYRRRLGDRASIDIAAFYNDYKDLAANMAQAPATSTDPVFHLVLPIGVVNATSAQTYGIEIAAEWRAFEALTVKATYSYIDLDVDGPPAGAIDAEAAEGFSPHHHATVQARWDYAYGAALDATVYYVDGLSGYDVKDYTRFDLRWSAQLSPSVRFELFGQNLLDDTHREFSAPTDVAATEIERSLYGRLVWRR